MISQALLRTRDATLIAYGVLGLWAFTNLEIAYALLRVDERRRTYLIASVSNVLLTVALTVTLVVGFDAGARGYVLGNYAASTVVLVGLWVFALRQRVGLDLRAPSTLGPLLRFGAPTVPADAAVFALNVVDRAWLLRADSPAAAGLYAVAVKLATLVIVAVRGFQAAWPPLAYSIVDEDEARHLYALVTTAYVVVTGLVVAGLTLLGRWVVRLLTADPFYPAHKALPWVALGWALYGLFLVFVTIAGRAKVTTRTFPAAVVGLAVNVVGLALLVDPLGPSGAGIALCAVVPGDARGRPPAHAAAVHGALRLAAPGADRGASSAPSRWRASWRCRPAAPPGFALRTLALVAIPLALAPELLRLRRELVSSAPNHRAGSIGPARRAEGRAGARASSWVKASRHRHPGAHDPPVPPRRAGGRQRARARRLRQLGLVRHVQRHHDAAPPPARRARPRSSPPRRARWAPSSSTPRAARCTCGTPTTAPRARAAAPARRRGRR